MHDKLETVLGEQGGHSDAIGKIELGKAHVFELGGLPAFVVDEGGELLL